MGMGDFLRNLLLLGRGPHLNLPLEQMTRIRISLLPWPVVTGGAKLKENAIEPRA